VPNYQQKADNSEQSGLGDSEDALFLHTTRDLDVNYKHTFHFALNLSNQSYASS